MKRILLLVLVAGAVAGALLVLSRWRQLEAGSVRQLAVTASAVTTVLEHEGFHVEAQNSDDTMGAIYGVGASGEQVLVVWGPAQPHGMHMSARVQAQGRDDLWVFNRSGAITAAITREVCRQCGYPVSEHPDLASATEAPFVYESK